MLGNLFEDDLLAIWNGARAQTLRRNLIHHEPEANKACKGCDLPYDSDKFRTGHILRRAVERLGILK